MIDHATMRKAMIDGLSRQIRRRWARIEILTREHSTLPFHNGKAYTLRQEIAEQVQMAGLAQKWLDTIKEDVT